jgi:hypothetical protein
MLCFTVGNQKYLGPDFIWSSKHCLRASGTTLPASGFANRHRNLAIYGEHGHILAEQCRTMPNCELFDLLDSFAHFECQEGKDRIYALAALASDVRTSSELMPFTAGGSLKKMTLVPDYSLSDEEVFRQVALQRMQSGRAFTTLA